jgi:hypothetical protein
MKANHVKSILTSILKKNEDARDDMFMCIKIIHDFEMGILNIPKETYYDAFFQRKLSKITTIAREWAKIQETNINLRGKEWEIRQKKSKKIAKDIMNDKNQLTLFNF